MRTDSTNLSEDAVQACRSLIEAEFGEIISQKMFVNSQIKKMLRRLMKRSGPPMLRLMSTR